MGASVGRRANRAKANMLRPCFNLLVSLVTLVAACSDTPAETDPCAGVDCSGQGTCVEEGGEAACLCFRGYEPAGLECVPEGPDGDADGDVDGDGDADGDVDGDGNADGDVDGDGDADGDVDGDVDGDGDGDLCAGVDCSHLDDNCLVGECDPATGRCWPFYAPDGAGCDDGDPCTAPDECSGGVCGGSAFDCSHLTADCHVGVCSAAAGGCTTTPAPDGTPCDDGDPGTSGDACTAGICSGGSTSLTPGDTTTVISLDGWSVRCLAWSGAVCTHLQTMMDCLVCAVYAYCGRWHDMTTFNNDSSRMTMNWCALATGDAGIVSEGAGGVATTPHGCGYSSRSHPVCEASRATYHVDVAGVVPDYGLMLDNSYCGTASTLMTVECVGW